MDSEPEGESVMGKQTGDEDSTCGPEKPREAVHSAETKKESAKTGKRKWDIIDENAWESFPASDAPGSWAGRDIPPDERETKGK